MAKTEYSVADITTATGLSKHVLHKWEARYGAITPHRTPAGHRRYSHEDLERLHLLVALTQAGHAIGQVAPLSTADLETLLGESAASPSLEQPVRVRVCGMAISATLAGHILPPGTATIELGTERQEFDAAWLEAGERSAADLLVVEVPALGPSFSTILATFAQRTGTPLVVVHRFASRNTVSTLLSAGVICLKGPVDGDELLQQIRTIADAIRDPSPREPSNWSIAPRRFRPETLTRLIELAPTIACECPNHIAQLLLDVTSFEDYSLQCENMNDDDARVHRYLRWVSASARNLLEDALQRVAEVDGIDLEAIAAGTTD